MNDVENYIKWLTNDENTEIKTDEGVATQGMTNSYKVCVKLMKE